MEIRASYMIVGVVVLALIAGLATFSTWLIKVDIDEQATVYKIYFEGSVTGLQEGSQVQYRGIPVGRIAEIGIARTFQNTELFERETVLKNLLIGCHIHRRSNLLSELLFLPSVRRGELALRQSVEDVIDLLDLQSHRDKPISELPFGARKMVEIARALCLRPKLLLLDEPSSGLNPEETEDLAFWLEDINEELGITVMMVEHDMNLVSRASNRVLAMADGALLVIGAPSEVQSHPQVQRAYLGG